MFSDCCSSVAAQARFLDSIPGGFQPFHFSPLKVSLHELYSPLYPPPIYWNSPYFPPDTRNHNLRTVGLQCGLSVSEQIVVCKCTAEPFHDSREAWWAGLASKRNPAPPATGLWWNWQGSGNTAIQCLVPKEFN